MRQDRLSKQLDFLTEADKLKSVLRGTTLCDASRRENSGEHSWHVALFALILAEHASRPVRIDRVIRMLLIHDLVEIDAGDHPIHGDHDASAIAEIERIAAERIFGLLPPDQGEMYSSLWNEFEAAETDDAIFAKSIDRTQPLISNLETKGTHWRDFNVTYEQLESRVGAKIQRGAPTLWQHLKVRISAYFNQ